MAKSTGLGRGLGALIGTPKKLAAAEPDAAAGERVERMPVGDIAPSPLQPRKTFDDEKLAELTESIRARGVMQPLIVRRVGSGCELIAGERRWRASQAAGLDTVPVIVREASDRDVLELALIENLQRADLDPIEEAEGYQDLMKRFQLTQEQVSEVVGKKRATVANAVRLLTLPEDVRLFLKSGRLSAGHGKAILGLRRDEEQVHAATKVLKDNLTVRETERLVEDIQRRTGTKPAARKSGGKKDGAKTGGGAAVMSDLEKRIQRALGTRVKIHGDGEAGRIEIQYYTPDELNRLIDQFGVEGY